MAWAEFEEREYETPLYHQLLAENHYYWSPGQVLEHRLGFDYSMFCADSYFWAMQGFTSPLRGVYLSDVFLHAPWRRRPFPRPLPDFSLNLFLQAKRPAILRRLSKPLRGSSVNSPYWRIGLEPEQQRVLEQLGANTSGRSLVCYAAPAFHRLSQLYAHTKQGTVVANSTFPQAAWLRGHGAWNYDKPGSTGVANAEPREIEGPPLRQQVLRLIEENQDIAESSYEENLGVLERAVRAAVTEQAAESARQSFFFQRAQEVDARARGYVAAPYREPISAFLKVLAFVETFGLQWYVVGQRAYV